MKRISARYLLGMPTAWVKENLFGTFILVFDDGDLEVKARPTIFSSFAWDFHRKYPKTPLLKEHHVSHVLKAKRLGSSTHLRLLGNAMWSVWEAYKHEGTVSLDDLAKMTYRLTNLIYNDLTYHCEESVTGLNIIDYIEILDHPDVLAAKKDAPATEASIVKIHTTITNVLVNDPKMEHNPVSRAVRSGVANLGQVLQCVGPRGFVYDMDSYEFPRPIMRSFAEGLRDFYDSLIESRQAAMALAQSKDPLEQTEYFSRRLQLICQSLQNLHRYDCGSTQYLYWTVRDKVVDEEDGRLIQKSDLDLLAGKYFVDASGGLNCIQKDDKHLLGHTLKLRSVLHCACADPYGVCATCFGDLALSIPEGSNLGQQCCTSMTEVVSQLVLSTKHFVGGQSAAGVIQLDNESKHFLAVTPDRTTYLLNDRLRNQPLRMIIPHQHAANFTDILDVSDVTQLTSVSRISELPDIGLLIGHGADLEPVTLHVAVDRRMASMTYPLLDHIKRKGWTINERGHYVIDMEGWDFSKPILTLPVKRYNMSDHSAEIADILEASIKDVEDRDKAETVDPTMVKLFDHVNQRLNVNLAVLEIVLYGGMVVSAAKGDYAFPKVGTDRGLGVMDLTIENRSLSAKMAYEHQLATILSARNYITPNRMDHPFDGILMPYETLQHLE
jgi:hypothetical protein